jgi:hypothetical protein
MKHTLALVLMVFGSFGAFAETETYDEDWKYLHCPLNEDEGGYFGRYAQHDTDDIYIKIDMNSFKNPRRKEIYSSGKFEAKTINVSYIRWKKEYWIDLVQYKNMTVKRFDSSYSFGIRVRDDSLDKDWKFCSHQYDAIDGVIDLVSTYCENKGGFRIERDTLQLRHHRNKLGICKFVTENEYEEPFLKWKEIKINEAKSRVEENKKQLEERINNRQF